MTRTGDYYIYSFYNKEYDIYEKEFFLPDSDFKHYMYRVLSVASRKEKGYQIAGILYVNKETYLNARLSKTVEDYLYEDHLEEETRKKYKNGAMSRDVYLDTIKLCQDFKWTCLKKLDMQIRRMVREDFDVENEIALQLYDQYLRCLNV
jgi:hypothetical protein